MFVGYYKTLNNGDIVCILSRGVLRKADTGISIKNTLLEFDEITDYAQEANRFYLMIENQDIFTLNNSVSSTIQTMCKSLLLELRNNKLNNISKKCSLLINIEIYTPDQADKIKNSNEVTLLVFDKNNKWSDLGHWNDDGVWNDSLTVLSGKPYIKYKLKTGKDIKIVHDLIEDTV